MAARHGATVRVILFIVALRFLVLLHDNGSLERSLPIGESLKLHNNSPSASSYFTTPNFTDLGSSFSFDFLRTGAAATVPPINTNTSNDTPTTAPLSVRPSWMIPTEQELQFWNGEHCFYVEDLCHVSHHLFYRQQEQQQANNVTTNIRQRHQPRFVIQNRHTLPAGYPRESKVEVAASSPYTNLTCTPSPISHHMIMTGLYNQMLVEFLNRIYIGAYLSLTNHPANLPMNQVQLYLLMHERGPVFDGHRLFLNTLPSTNPLLDYRRLLDAGRCTCLPRVAFCGYRVEEKKVKERTTRQEEDVTEYHLYPGERDVGREIRLDVRRRRHVFAKMRQDILRELHTANPFWQEMIVDHRVAQLQRVHKMSALAARAEQGEWKFVGLCQRDSRRKWSNFNTVLEQCNTKYKHDKILCVEINVDKPESGHMQAQAVLHGSIQALFGVHGSHLGNALLLPTNAYVVEVMSWFPDFMPLGRGWARRTDAHTPIGVLFFETDLNHLGFLLERESAPQLCPQYIGKPDQEEQDYACLRQVLAKNRNSIWWGSRDFSIDPLIVTTFIDKFMVTPQPHTCAEFQQKQAEGFMVDGKNKTWPMYNVQCAEMADSNTTKAHHYYTQESVLEEAAIKARNEARGLR